MSTHARVLIKEVTSLRTNLVRLMPWRRVPAMLMAAALAVAVAFGLVVWNEARERRAQYIAPVPVVPPRPIAFGFRDITRAARLNFKHNNGASGVRRLPETLGAGCAFLDFDGDGWQDIFLVNGRNWTPHELWVYRSGTGREHARKHKFVIPRLTPKRRTTGALFRNNRNGTFSDVTKGSGLEVEMYGMGAAVGDYDNDGKVDLYVTAIGRNYLFGNMGARTAQRRTASRMSTHVGAKPRFREVAAQAGVRDGGWSSSAAWLDYDRDGKLDLFVCHYVAWTPKNDVWNSSRANPNRKQYASPTPYAPTFCRLYRNLGASFREVSQNAGIAPLAAPVAAPARSGGDDLRGKSLGVAVLDFDGDGWPDIAVTNDTTPNFLFHNDKNGTFSQVAARLGFDSRTARDAGGGQNARAGMGVDAGDMDGRNRDGLVVGNFSLEGLRIYQNHGAYFTDFSADTPVARASQDFVQFGCVFADFDLDSRLDILVANGHIVAPEFQPAQRPLLFHNVVSNAPAANSITNVANGIASPGAESRKEARTAFEEVGLLGGKALSNPIVGRGLACADMDLDGDLDVLITANGGAPELLRNDGGNTNNSVRVTLQGTKSNRSGIGAVVEATVVEATIDGTMRRIVRRTVKSGSSYLSQSELPLAIGLGKETQLDALLVRWPSGRITKIGKIAANQSVLINEERGLVRRQPLHRK